MILKFNQNTDTPKIMTLTEDIFLLLPNSGLVFIKAPFDYDGNSTPIGFYNLVPKHMFKLCSLFHDDLCNKAKNNSDRKKADKDYIWIFETFYPKNKFRRRFAGLGVTLGRFWWRVNGHYKRKAKRA